MKKAIEIKDGSTHAEILDVAMSAAHRAAQSVLTQAGLMKKDNDLLFSAIITTRESNSTATMLQGSYVIATRAYIRLLHEIGSLNLGGDFHKLLGLEDGMCVHDRVTIDQLAEITKSMLQYANPLAAARVKEQLAEEAAFRAARNADQANEK